MMEKFWAGKSMTGKGNAENGRARKGSARKVISDTSRDMKGRVR